MNVERHQGYLWLCRILNDAAVDSLEQEECALLGELGEDLFLCPPAREQAASQSCRAGAALLADAVRAGRLDEPTTEALWRNRCDCGPRGLWRPLGSTLGFARSVGGWTE